MKDKFKGIDSSWCTNISFEGDSKKEKLTFLGAFKKYNDYIACNWLSDSTIQKYNRLLNNKILPYIDNDNKSIDQYTVEDFYDMIDKIKKEGFAKNGQRKEYSESYIDEIKRIVYRTIFYTSKSNDSECENVFWNEDFYECIDNEESAVLEKTVLKKSLTEKQEILLFNSLTNKKLTGQEMAIFIMFACGTRVAEACGLNYGDIVSLNTYPDDHVAMIYKTTGVKTPELKTGGKTRNAGRIIPIPHVLYRVIENRKKELENLLEMHNIDNVNVDDLPIITKGELSVNNINDRCCTNDISIMASKYLSNIGIDPDQLMYFKKELKSNNIDDILNEKEPTAYMLRRNFATQMHILGLTISEIQYLIGHDIEDPYESRNAFGDDEHLHIMAEKLKNRAVFSLDENTEQIHYHSIKKREELIITVTSNEPCDPMKVNLYIPKNTKLNVTAYKHVGDSIYGRTVNIIKPYTQWYKDEYAKFKFEKVSSVNNLFIEQEK